MPEYVCKNCGKAPKIFSLIFFNIQNTLSALKLGELPPFGPPIPSKVNALIGADKNNFLKGYSIEKQGYGIGAFAYYRRIIESQWGRLVDEIIRAAKGVGSSEEIIKDLEKARDNTQFKRAVQSISPAIPEAIKINGHNPLTLIHKALSIGVHNLSDEDCLERAGQIRIVLFELAERLSMVLSGNRELTESVKALSELGNPRK